MHLRLVISAVCANAFSFPLECIEKCFDKFWQVTVISLFYQAKHDVMAWQHTLESNPSIGDQLDFSQSESTMYES